MEFICGAADFSEEKKSDPPKSFDGHGETVYSDNHVMLCRLVKAYGKTHFSSDNEILEISIGDTSISYSPASKELNFTCGDSGLHRLFFTFAGSAFIFSTDLCLLVQPDDKPSFFLGNGSLNNISEVKPGKSGCFSSDGLKFY